MAVCCQHNTENPSPVLYNLAVGLMRDSLSKSWHPLCFLFIIELVEIYMSVPIRLKILSEAYCPATQSQNTRQGQR